MSNTQLFFGDCLDVMSNIQDKSIDLIVCDLPYGTTACSWDNVICPDDLWLHYERIITDTGAILLFGTEPFSSIMRCSNLKLYKYDWIWVKSRPTCFVQAKNQPLRNYENIMVFSKGAAIHKGQTNRRMTYNPQGLIAHNKMIKQSPNTKNTDTCMSFRESQKSQYVQKFTNYPRQIITFASASKTVHSTQKPVNLLEYLILTYSEERDTVLDNAMGSGSTGEACINTNRDFIGIEINDSYFDIAKNRLEKITNNNKWSQI